MGGNILTILEQGLIYGVMALGVYISYRILDFPDLSVDGTFPLGAAVTASLVVNVQGINPWLCLIISLLAGALCGALTGVLHVKFRISNLLSGILMMTALYSINMHIASDRSTLQMNKGAIKAATIFNTPPVSLLPPALEPYRTLIVGLVLIIAAKLLLDWYLSTHNGFLLRAVGDNEQLIVMLGQSVGKMKIIGLAIANGLVAVSGSVFAQHQRYFDAGFGIGMIVTGLASVIIGQTIFGRIRRMKPTTAVILGAIIYKACTMLALQLGSGIGLKAFDLKLVTAVLFFIALVINIGKKKTGNRGKGRGTSASL